MAACTSIETAIHERRVLVVEDLYLLAADLVTALEECGAQVIGPVATIEEARRAIMAYQPECAILDVNLRGTMIYEVAALLRKRGVPFVFATGYEAEAIDPRFGETGLVQKPYDAIDVVRALGRALTGEDGAAVP